MPENITEIISGGAIGIDRCARTYALSRHIKLTEFLPEYKTYGRAAPIIRNMEIIRHSDFLIAFWDGESRGTKYVIKKCRELGHPFKVYIKK